MDDKTVTNLLKRAWAAVDGAGVPEHLHEVAYTAALEMLAGDSPAADASNGAGGSQARKNGRSTASGSVIDKVASELGLGASKVQRVFSEKNGLPELIVKSSKLPGPKASAAHDISLLMMVARQSAGLDDYTDSKVLREACKGYGKFDKNNFGTHIKSLDSLTVTKGSGRNQQRKLTKPGKETGSGLIEKYATETAKKS